MLKISQLTRSLNYILSLQSTQSSMVQCVQHCPLTTFSNYPELDVNTNRSIVELEKDSEELDHDGDVENIPNDYRQRIVDKYPAYKHILYSSYLDNDAQQFMMESRISDQWSSMDSSLNSRGKLKPRFRHKTHDYQRLLEKKTSIPENWLEDYEYYDDSLNTSKSNDPKTETETEMENSASKSLEILDNIMKLGKADETIPSSDVPCNGCGAHLHCQRHKKPGHSFISIYNRIYTIGFVIIYKL